MKKVFNIITNKYVWLVIGILFIVATIQARWCLGAENERLATYNRQLSGQLSEQERLLQSANHALGISNSTLVTQQELAAQLAKEKQELDENFETFKKEHNLIIKSKDLAIALLQQELQGNGGVTIVPITSDQELCLKLQEKCIIGYTWTDSYGRLSLIDPNIFKSGDETVTITQYFKVYSEIFEQADGSLQVKRLVLREVYKDGNEYKEIPGAKAEIIEHDFTYHNPPPLEIPEWSPLDLFKLRMIASVGMEVFPEPGDLRFGLGLQFFEWHGLSLNTSTSFDFDDPKNITQSIGVAWVPTFDNFQLNLGLGVSAGTPFYNLFQEGSVKIDLIFFVW